MRNDTRDLLGGLAAIALGAIVYFFIFGWWPLIPTNIAFLDHADRAMELASPNMASRLLRVADPAQASGLAPGMPEGVA